MAESKPQLRDTVAVRTVEPEPEQPSLWQKLGSKLGGRSVEAPGHDAIHRALRHTQKSTPVDIARHKRFAMIAIGAMEAATSAIEVIRAIVAEMREVAEDARFAEDKQVRRNCAKLYENFRNEIDSAAMVAQYEGVNLIDGGRSALSINMRVDSKAQFTISHTNLTAGRRGLNLPALRNGFETAEDVDEIIHHIDLAEEHLAWALRVYREEATLLAKRFEEDFKQAKG